MIMFSQTEFSVVFANDVKVKAFISCRSSVGIQMGMDIFIVRNGAVVPYLRDGSHHNAHSQLPLLPPGVTRINVTWMAEDDVV